LCLESSVRFPAHARWLGRQWGTIKGAAPICTTQALPQPFGAIDCALIAWLARRGVNQSLALATAKIQPAINLSAPATAFQARQPFPPAAKARGGICKWHELVDRDPVAVTIGDVIPQTNAIVLDEDFDRARPLAPARPRERDKAAWAQETMATQIREIDAEGALARWRTR
jgi:hypothetical protein